MYAKWGPIIYGLAIKMVRELEVALPDDGNGSAKAAAFDEFLRKLLEAADATEDTIDRLIPVGRTAVSTVVTLMNATGQLRHVANAAKADVAALSAPEAEATESQP